ICKLTNGISSGFYGLRYYNSLFFYFSVIQYNRKIAHKLFFNFGYQGYGANYYNLGNSDVPVNFKIGDVTEIYGNQKWVGLKYQIFEKENLAFFLGLDFRKRNEVIYQLIGKFLWGFDKFGLPFYEHHTEAHHITSYCFVLPATLAYNLKSFTFSLRSVYCSFPNRTSTLSSRSMFLDDFWLGYKF